VANKKKKKKGVVGTVILVIIYIALILWMLEIGIIIPIGDLRSTEMFAGLGTFVLLSFFSIPTIGFSLFIEILLINKIDEKKKSRYFLIVPTVIYFIAVVSTQVYIEINFSDKGESLVKEVGTYRCSVKEDVEFEYVIYQQDEEFFIKKYPNEDYAKLADYKRDSIEEIKDLIEEKHVELGQFCYDD